MIFATPSNLASHLLDVLFGGEQPDESITVFDAVQMAGGIQYPVENGSDEYDRVQRSVWFDIAGPTVEFPF
jgi:hypothetical protein